MPGGHDVKKMAPRFPIPKTRVVMRVPELVRLCQGKRVLHLGCTDAPYTLQRGDDLLHKLLARIASKRDLWGLDVSQEGVSLLQEMGFENVICGDAEDLIPELRNERFDVIVAGEIIEHLANPGRFFGSIKKIMHADSELVLTTPNATAIKRFAYAMLRIEKVHPDHNYYFSYRTLKQLVEKCGLHCREIYYYQEIQGKGMTRALDRTFALLTRISPVWADGVIVRAGLLN